ncbi:MAG: hypothetical protein U0P45_08135 [Acidimicrobiales bacterium]
MPRHPLAAVAALAVGLIAVAAPGARPAAAFPPQRPTKVLILGDSVMKGADPQYPVALPGRDLTIDTMVNRSTGQGADVVAKVGADWDVVVVLLGHNDGGSPGAYQPAARRILDQLRGVPYVSWLTIHEVRPYYPGVNQYIAGLQAEYPNLHVGDWNAVANAHPEALSGDGLHLNGTGAKLMADTVATQVKIAELERIAALRRLAQATTTTAPTTTTTTAPPTTTTRAPATTTNADRPTSTAVAQATPATSTASPDDSEDTPFGLIAAGLILLAVGGAGFWWRQRRACGRDHLATSPASAGVRRHRASADAPSGPPRLRRASAGASSSPPRPRTRASAPPRLRAADASVSPAAPAGADRASTRAEHQPAPPSEGTARSEPLIELARSAYPGGLTASRSRPAARTDRRARRDLAPADAGSQLPSPARSGKDHVRCPRRAGTARASAQPRPS